MEKLHSFLKGGKNNFLLIVGVFVLLAFFLLPSLIRQQKLSIKSADRDTSVELGFSSYSPRGVEGGAIVPASCELGEDHGAAFGCDKTLNVLIVSGLGTVTGSGISCPGDCYERYSYNTSVTLTASPAPGYTFNEWAGLSGASCVGVGNPCTIVMWRDRVVRADFDAIPFNYSLSNSGTSNVTKRSGQNAFTTNTITKTLTAGATQSVTLSLSGVPDGISYAISSSSCSPTCTSVITFTVTPSAPIGTYPITVTGSPLERQTSFDLVVSGSPISVTCSATPAVALVGDVVTWRATVTGGNEPFTFSWSGTNIPTIPAPPDSNPFRITYSTVGQKTARVRVNDRDDVEGTCSAATVQINFDPDIIEI